MFDTQVLSHVDNDLTRDLAKANHGLKHDPKRAHTPTFRDEAHPELVKVVSNVNDNLKNELALAHQDLTRDLAEAHAHFEQQRQKAESVLHTKMSSLHTMHEKTLSSDTGAQPQMARERATLQGLDKNPEKVEVRM